MSASEFKATLQMLVPMVVSAISERFGVPEDDAISQFYLSRVYADLEREPTKLWHLSPVALAELWHEERETGRVTYPEGA